MIKQFLKIIWRRRRKNAFLMAEIMLAFFATFAVLSFSISKLNKWKVPMGFESENIYVVNLSINEIQKDSTAYKLLREQLKREINSIVGIESCSYSALAPFSNNTWSTGNTDQRGFSYENTHYILADKDYIDVYGIKTKKGVFYDQDLLQAKYQPVVINKLFKDRYLRDSSELDFTLTFNGDESVIVGVVEHNKYKGEFMEEVPLIFAPMENRWNSMSVLNIRTAPHVGPEIEKEISNVVAQVTKNYDFSLENLHETRKVKARSSWIPIIGLLCLAVFIMINIAMGLFGILQYSISKRRPEIGLRKALGASPGKINMQFVGEMFVLVTISLLVGLIFAAQFPILNVFGGQSGVYWKSILISICIIYSIVLLCSFVPSAQAARIDPAKALRAE